MHLIALAWDVDRPGLLDPGVHALARSIGRQGASCEVVTLGAGPTSTRRVDGVDVTWVAEAPPVMPASPDYDVARALAAATRASGAAERRCQLRVPDAVLALGWQTAYTATTLRASRGVPIVALLDSIAPGRSRGDLDAAGRVAAQVEWWLTYEARRVVVDSVDLRRQVQAAFRLPAAKIDVVPSGVDPSPVAAPAPEDPDVTVVADAATTRSLRRRLRGTRVAVDADEVTRAPVVVVLDDLRGDLVLRAMAAGAAVVVPDAGPLRGLVHAGRSGVRVSREPADVATAVRQLRADDARRARLGRRARERVTSLHAWQTVAAQHLRVARLAVAEEAELVRSARMPRPLRPQLLRSPLLGLVGDPDHPPTNGPHVAEGHG